jgi:hypothetical protein
LLEKLVIFVIILLVIRFFVRNLLPLLLGSYLKKKMSEMQQNQDNYRPRQQRREGEVIIDLKPSEKKKYPDNTGDYVDFEEIK